MVTLVLTGCGKPPTLDAPEVRWGQDVCAECGMILTDERFAAARVEIRDGERQVALFDDLGEMLEPRPSSASAATPVGEDTPHRYWVRDAGGAGWIDAHSATYLRSAKLHTPMGMGLAAYRDADAADSAREQYPGQVLGAADFAVLTSDDAGVGAEESETPR